MSKKEIYECDIEGCKNEPEHKNKRMQVVFITETTEGRPTDPHFGTVDIDICEQCLNKMAVNRRYITAAGAMGYNKYYIINKK